MSESDITIPVDLPTTLTVMLPAGRALRNYGVNATSHHDAKRTMLRWAPDDYRQVEKWARLLNITETHFVRDATMNTVAALEKLAKQWSKDNAHHSDSGGE